ncbi:MAG: type I-D CRISPR-associated helicase Cas3' [bacterium]
MKPQYVKQTDALGQFPDGKGNINEFPLHLVQKRIKEDFDNFPEFTVITAPTGTGKSYAFPFPVLESQQKGSFGGLRQGKRGLVVLPTNALIDELHENFSDMYKNEISIGKITGKHLNEIHKKGFDRWTGILEIAQSKDLIITNPDIINYAMHGGYHKRYWGKTGRNDFHNFLDFFDYIIFDEYHLYDEAQIANILTLTYMRELFSRENHKIKYLFVSATPEKGLQEVLKDFRHEHTEIIEEIVSDKEKARAIHGKLDVEIHHARNYTQLIESKYNEIETEIKAGGKVLVIFDTLAELMQFSRTISNQFPDYIIVQSTGYAAEDENQNEKIKTANIILATNKAEVGVNYGVEYAIMQPGMFYGNFVQRFGRVARGDLDGKIIVALKENVQFNRLKKAIQELEYNYYEFLDIIQAVFKTKKFYSEVVPSYIGEYIWCIKENIYQTTEYGKKIGNYQTFQTFENRINEIGISENPKYSARYNLFQSIRSKIWKLKQIDPKGNTVKEIEKWWNRYRDTYLTFRDASKIVQIVDEAEQKELSYSLEWILQYKTILNIEEIKKENITIEKYTVGDQKERDKDLQYEISTIPTLSETPAIAMYSDLNADKKLKRLFESKVQELIKKRKKGWTEFDKAVVELLDKVKLLSLTFSRKRLKIENIITNNQFL